MAVTEDIEKMVSRMSGWTSLDDSFISQFRDEEVNKKLIHNNHPDISKLAKGLLNEYIEEKGQLEYEDIDN